MLRTLAALLVRKSNAWAIIVIVVIATVLLATQATHVDRDDDLLAFLPKTNQDIKVFYDVNHRFGGLDVALVGVETDDALAPAFLAQLRLATTRLNETKGVDYAMSLTNLEDFTPDLEKGGIGVDYLVPQVIPSTPEGLAALREKVMSRDQAVGNVIAADGKAALIICFLGYGNDPKTTAGAVREVVEKAMPGARLFWGGAPFVQNYIFGVTQKDLARLTPWACIVIVLISLWAFRDGVGMLLALFTTAVGIVAALGLMSIFDVKTNLVLGSMPVILFALGSAYPIHILVRYYAVVGEMGRDKAIEHVVTYLGPTVIASGLTAVGGLLSFVAMDMAPIRTFGLFTGIGVLVTLTLSVTFVPAVIRVADLKARVSMVNHTSRGMIRFSTAIGGHPVAIGVAIVALALGSAVFVGRIDSRIDNSSFYSANSTPAIGEVFLRERFGGSQFFQIQVQGDMNQPEVLREVRRIADDVRVLPHVSSVNHVAAVVAKINEAMEGDERVPDTAAKVKLLYGFLAGKRAVSQLLSDDRGYALMHVKVDSDRAGDLEEVLARVEEVVKHTPADYEVVDPRTGSADRVGGDPQTPGSADRVGGDPQTPGSADRVGGDPQTPGSADRAADARAHLRELVVARVGALAATLGVTWTDGTKREVASLLDPAGPRSAALHAHVDDPKPIEAAILRYLGSEEFTAEMPKSPADAPRRVAVALAALPARAPKDAFAKAVAEALDRPVDDPAVLDVASLVRVPVAEILRRQHALAEARALTTAAKITLPEGSRGARFVAGVGAALLDLDATRVAIPARDKKSEGAEGGKLATTVTGTPVLNRGLSRSVDENQIKSFCMAMGLVLVIVLYLYRSLTSALLAMVPVSLTLLVVYGGMGLLGVHLDIGTSMLASLTTGAGVDYALHLLAAWKGADTPGKGTPEELKSAASYSSFLVGRAIWTNALMVAGGFVVLTMGEARPLQNVGGLTAAAMMVAALATFVTIPLLARKRSYDPRPRIAELLPSSDEAGRLSR